MKNTIMFLVALLSLSLVAVDADAARRLGGGTSIGRQRQITPTPKPAAPSATPAAPAQQPSGMSKWLGPLAGLALGAGLASLFMNNGLAGALGGILMIMLIAAAAMFAWRMLSRKPQSAPMQYARAGAPVPPSDGAPNISNIFGGAATAPTATVNRFPPGFDAEQFAHHAKLNFTQLQAAHDRRDLSTMRDFMTPELYAEIAAQIEKDPAPQKTEVVTLDAEVLEVVTEGEAYVASVRFSGAIREAAPASREQGSRLRDATGRESGAAPSSTGLASVSGVTSPEGAPVPPSDGAALPESFNEVWHLEKPINGNTGWLISGIQQD